VFRCILCKVPLYRVSTWPDFSVFRCDRCGWSKKVMKVRFKEVKFKEREEVRKVQEVRIDMDKVTKTCAKVDSNEVLVTEVYGEKDPLVPVLRISFPYSTGGGGCKRLGQWIDALRDHYLRTKPKREEDGVCVFPR